ncbi:MAG: TetR family transcriptional regulator [Ilumatobacteraceae bacterium]
MAVDPPTASLRQRKKDATEKAIVDAAWGLFEARGYANTSINDIAEAANVAPRTFFRYFASKEAVAYPEFDEMTESIRTAFFTRPRDEPPLASLLASFDALSALTEDGQRNRARLELIKHEKSPAVADYFRKRMTEAIETMVLERDGDRPDAKLRARLTSGIVGLIIETSQQHWIETGAAEPMEDVGHRCFSMVADLLTFHTGAPVPT